VQALQRSPEPLLEQAYSRLGAVLYLAYLLSEMPVTDHDALESLPMDVLDSLKLDFDWMTATLPARASFVDVALA